MLPMGRSIVEPSSVFELGLGENAVGFSILVSARNIFHTAGCHDDNPVLHFHAPLRGEQHAAEIPRIADTDSRMARSGRGPWICPDFHFH